MDHSYLLKRCMLCPRECGAARLDGEAGMCGMSSDIYVARAALHMWEEPCISGKEGSGTVFFTGCSLGCVYCQNQAIAKEHRGTEISVSRLAEIYLSLQEQGANNINLVTAEHYVPQVCDSLTAAKAQGLRIPVVYNSGGYEKVETLKILDGLVDVYLPDFKYMDPQLAEKYSHAPDYPETAMEAIREMVRQSGEPAFDDRGMIKKGVIVRHLLLPGHVKDAKQVVEYLYRTYGDGIYLSLMSQYTPMEHMKQDPLLGRRVTRREYERLVDHAVSIGVTKGFIQDREVAEESFIPSFDGEGVRD
ncbi:MAG: radical SAM protein [Lachnospiraceae bacterium]|nr:radical SAM protein [Lachnospiraceae bacterium]